MPGCRGPGLGRASLGVEHICGFAAAEAQRLAARLRAPRAGPGTGVRKGFLSLSSSKTAGPSKPGLSPPRRTGGPRTQHMHVGTPPWGFPVVSLFLTSAPPHSAPPSPSSLLEKHLCFLQRGSNAKETAEPHRAPGLSRAQAARRPGRAPGRHTPCSQPACASVCMALSDRCAGDTGQLPACCHGLGPGAGSLVTLPGPSPLPGARETSGLPTTRGTSPCQVMEKRPRAAAQWDRPQS